MSIKALNWAYEQPLKGRAKHVLCALANRANEQNQFQCWPSLNTIAFDSGCASSTVQKALKELRSKRLISWVPQRRPDGGSSSNLYRLAVSPLPRKSKGGADLEHPPIPRDGNEPEEETPRRTKKESNGSREMWMIEKDIQIVEREIKRLKDDKRSYKQVKGEIGTGWKNRLKEPVREKIDILNQKLAKLQDELVAA